MKLKSLRRKLGWVSFKASMKLRKLIGAVAKPDGVDIVLSRIEDPGSYKDVAGKVIVVTGSSRGIGQAVAGAMAKKGARVVINGRDAASVEAAVKQITDDGGQAAAAVADISTAEGATALLDQSLAAFGRVDVLIVNAGLAGPSKRKAWEVEPDEWKRVMATNIDGAFYCSKAFVEWMLQNKVAGRIIQVSTGAAQAGHPGMAPYVASKFALEGFTKTLAMDLDGSGITVAAIRLGSTRGDMAREVFTAEEYNNLPPAETAAAVFLYAATAPPELINGRIIASWRFNADEYAEPRLSTPIALFPRFKFNPPELPAHVRPERVVALERAENPYGMPESVRTILATTNGHWQLSKYPDMNYTSLREALSARHGLPPECFTFSAGSTELVERTLRLWVGLGEQIISNDPSWFMFDRVCDMYGISNVKARFAQDPQGQWHHNLEQILGMIRVNTRLIYLVHPSNPVGVPIRHEEFRRFIEQVPQHLPVVVDEAYIDYADRDDILKTDKLVRETDRTVIALRTFSKFFGLAGMRIGYAYGSEATIGLFNRLEMPFVLSSVAAAAAEAALRDEAHARRTYDGIVRERRRVEAFLAQQKLQYIPSQTNLIMAECPGNPVKFYDRSRSKGLLIPKGIFLDRYTIFPISLPEHNDRNMELFGSVA